MKKFLTLIGSLLLVLPAIAQNTTTFAGNARVDDFAYGTRNHGPALQVGGGGGTSGSYTITLNYGKTVTGASGLTFYPFSGPNFPALAIGSGATYEVVTPSAANCGPGAADTYQQCQITATFTYAHGAGDVVRSGDGGIFEAATFMSSLGPQRLVVTLTNAQILALQTAPVQLLPAPGTGVFYTVNKAILVNENTGTAYAGTPGVITVGYTSSLTTNALSGTVAATFLTSPTAPTAITVTGGVTAATATSALSNQPIYINVATNNPTTGTGTLKVILEYSISVQ